jgi:ATP-dependent Zn protease
MQGVVILLGILNPAAFSINLGVPRPGPRVVQTPALVPLVPEAGEFFLLLWYEMIGPHNANHANLRGVAYHEAGHCVAAILCGRTIRYVTIIPAKRKNAQGRIMLGRTLMQPPRKALSTEQTNVEINCYLMNCLAGAVCESAATGKPVEPSSIDADVKDAIDVACAVFGADIGPDTRQRVISGLYRRAQKFFTDDPRRCRAVRRVAEALLVRRTLTGGEVRHIVLQAVDADT